jgi:hypothetical protein
MARRVFFSFHYERDIWRANVVRMSWITQNRLSAGFWDGSLWEEARNQGDVAIKRMIDNGLRNTSVTVVLIGARTAYRKWVLYEIEESIARGNGLLGVYISGIRDKNRKVDEYGPNPFDRFEEEDEGELVPLSEIVQTYDYFEQDGYTNLGSWIEEAAGDVGR